MVITDKYSSNVYHVLQAPGKKHFMMVEAAFTLHSSFCKFEDVNCSVIDIFNLFLSSIFYGILFFYFDSCLAHFFTNS